MQARHFHLLEKNDLQGEIEIHSDILSIVPSALSRKRALKTGRERQAPMEDKDPMKCILCDPSLKPIGASPSKELIKDRVAHFENDFPYLPGDQQVLFLWHSDLNVRRSKLHRLRLSEFGRSEIYWLTKGCIQLAQKFPIPDDHYDLMRMVAGFNLGSLAGQSIAHFHIQYGWEVVLNRRSISKTTLELYFEELQANDLVLYHDEHVKVIAPWTPKGQFAIDLYFNGKHELTEMSEHDLKLFAVFGRRIVEKYLSLGIQNLNIVFENSPVGRKIDPLVAHFVPRVNMTALYEIKGVNVVDTPPSKIAEEFDAKGPMNRTG